MALLHPIATPAAPFEGGGSATGFWATVTFSSPGDDNAVAAGQCDPPHIPSLVAALGSTLYTLTSAPGGGGSGRDSHATITHVTPLGRRVTTLASAVGGLLCGTTDGHILVLQGYAGAGAPAVTLDLPLFASGGGAIVDLCVRFGGGDNGPSLWALQADGSLCSVMVSALLGGTATAASPAPRITRYSTLSSLTAPCRLQVVPERRMPVFEEVWGEGEEAVDAHHRRDLVVIAGGRPCVAAFRSPAQDDATVSLTALAAAAATSITSAVSSAARELDAMLAPSVATGLKSLWGATAVAARFIEAAVTSRRGAVAGGGGGGGGGGNGANSAVAPEGPPALLELDVEFRDDGRTLQHLVADPSGRFLLAADSLGRVMLLDALDLVVLRYWKGYRAAQVAWLEGGSGRGAHLAVIFAPRRKQVEVWPVVGPRVGVVKVAHPEDALLLAHFDAPAPFSGSLPSAAARVFVLERVEPQQLLLSELTLTALASGLAA